MSLTTTINKVVYACDGTTTTFSFDFPIIEPSDLQVYLYDSSGVSKQLTLNVDYTLTQTDTGGSITTSTAYATGNTLLLYREVPFTQETVYTENDPFPAKSHERALDKLTMETQQLEEKIKRALLADIITTNVDVQGKRIINVSNPASGSDACNYQTALGLVSGTISVHDLTDKGNADSGDELLITDSSDGYINKKITVYEFPRFDYINNVDPAIDTNPTKLYATWLNSSTGIVFVCIDNTAGANVWKEIALNDLTNVADTTILDKLKNVDGSGSGLDTDLIRGLPGDFTSSLSTAGYQKLPSELIIQWGTSAIGTGTNTNEALFTYPVAFPNALLGWMVGADKRDTTTLAYFAIVPANVAPSTTAIQGAALNYDGTAHTDTTDYIDFIVIGY